MANKIYEEEHIRDIANAIREKNGTQNSYLVSEMGDAIRAIEGSESVPGIDLTVIDSGICGESVRWELYDNGLLHISGQGDMFDYDFGSTSPFYLRQDILNVVIDYGITSIGVYMFWRCNSLTTISIPSSVKIIKLNSFQSCNLESILIPEGVETIENIAFHSCSNIKSVIIPKSLTYIGNGAFANCDNLSTVYYAGTKEEWNAIIINNDEGSNDMLLNADICYNYKDSSTQPTYKPEQEKSVTITESGTTEVLPDDGYTMSKVIINVDISTESRPEDAYNNLIPIDSGVCGDNVSWSYYDDGAFVVRGVGAISNTSNASISIVSWDAYRQTATTVIIGKGITSIGDNFLRGFTNITSIAIPYGVTSIGMNAFRYCSILSNIVIPDTVTNIGGAAFKGCSALTDICYTGTVEEWDCITIQNDNTEIDNASIHYNYRDTASVGLYDESFINLLNGTLTEIIVPNECTNLRNYAFYNLASLTKATLPDTITKISDYAFRGCSGLRDINIPDSVTEIRTYAFYGCTSLTKVTIPSGVITLGSYAFYNCVGVTDIYIHSTTPPTAGNATSVPPNAKIHVPTGCGDTYKNATNWSGWASRIYDDI